MPDASSYTNINDSIYSAFFLSIVCVGGLLSGIALFAGNSTSVILNLTSYSCLFAGVSFIIGALLHNLGRKANTTSIAELMNRKGILSFFMNIMPFFIILGAIGYLMYLMIAYRDKIESGHVSPNFKVFNNIASLLVCIQVLILYLGMKKDKYKETLMIPPLYNSLITLVGVINIIYLFILISILYYFTTDG